MFFVGEGGTPGGIARPRSRRAGCGPAPRIRGRSCLIAGE